MTEVLTGIFFVFLLVLSVILLSVVLGFTYLKIKNPRGLRITTEDSLLAGFKVFLIIFYTAAALYIFYVIGYVINEELSLL